MRNRLLAIAVSSVLSVSVPAQDTRIDTSKVRTIDEVEVVSSRRQHVMTSTAPLHLLDRDDMLRLGITDVADALHRLPGITLRDYGGAGGMKTVSVRGFGAKHTGVSYDGVMLSECQSGEIDLSRYSLDNVEHIQLTVGDNDDIFIPARQASVPAALSISSIPLLTGNHAPHVTAQLKLGSFGYVSPFLKYEQSLSDHFAFSALGEYTYAENDYPYTIKNVTIVQHDRRTNSRMNSGHGELNFAWSINSQNRLSGKLYYYDNDRQLPGQVRYYTNVSHESLRDRNFFGQLLYQTRWSGKWSLKWHAKFNWAASLYNDGLTASQIDDAHYYQRETYTSACILYVPDSHWTFDYSLDYSFNNLNSTQRVDSRPYRHTVLQSATAKYTTRRLTVMGCLLYSLYLNEAKNGSSARNMRRLSPSLSMAYAVTDELRLRASYKEIFRSPTFSESYFFHFGSTDLLPECTKQLNLGVTWQHEQLQGTSVQATLDGYYNQITDMIVAVPYNMFVWTCVNVGKVRVLGLEATLRVSQRLGQHVLSATGQYSYQQVHDRTNPSSPYYNNQIAYMPEHTASAAIAWENPWVNLSLHGVAVSDRWTTNQHLDGTRVNGYYDVGATAYRQFHICRSTFEVRFDIKNMTNRQYEIVKDYPMPRRSWQLTVNYKL